MLCQRFLQPYGLDAHYSIRRVPSPYMRLSYQFFVFQCSSSDVLFPLGYVSASLLRCMLSYRLFVCSIGYACGNSSVLFSLRQGLIFSYASMRVLMRRLRSPLFFLSFFPVWSALWTLPQTFPCKFLRLCLFCFFQVAYRYMQLSFHSLHSISFDSLQCFK